MNEGVPAFTAVDHAMMAQALRLAERGAYTTKPNPMVGCVIAQGETVVGEGCTGAPAARTPKFSRWKRPANTRVAPPPTSRSNPARTPAAPGRAPTR